MPVMPRGARRAVILSLFLSSAVFASVLLAQPHATWALSELKGSTGETQQPPQASDEPDAEVPADDGSSTGEGLPLPDPLINQGTSESGVARPQADDSKPVEVIRDIEKAPEPVRRMRELIVEAAASGDIERLRPLMNPGPNQTQVTVGESAEDPIEFLKSLSGDDEGIEVLAILLDIISTGFVHVGQGTADEMYVWPYFAEESLTSLTPPEKVELLRIVTAGDFADMLEFGGYNFYRIGITPDGQWKFFVAGD
ncbi:hypothetical protein MRS76_04065 [Rhizobiaceae bacterium n13]|uniref:Uncharacterized protein n=1 Tax=Ferirhizobium litorale TaxID=2927786 RepID=A0AAE3QCB1_9HYPH|nr:hypothetical protein [Fererhizobium litorale]MDI7861123.1 hypothetical protein [Fererhizobium litorale]MDI7921270.1 hypothetical protein [Fererhizobium litorale]